MDGFESVVAGDEMRFKQGRNGDHLMTPFQCDLCHFRNMKMRDPDPQDYLDRKLFQYIRRASLDSLWSREPATVGGNLSQARAMERCGRSIGLESVSPKMGPFPVEDSFGMKVACAMLERSLDPGKWEATIQFATARKVRSAYSNIYHASANVGRLAVMAYESTKSFHTTCETYGYWFERFILGCHKRMGDLVMSDYAVSIELLHELLRQLEEDWEETKSVRARDKIVTFANVLTFGFGCALRGEEIPKTDAAGFLKYLEVGAQDEKCPHVVVPLMGRLKGETGERYHLMILSRRTTSGIECGKWADRLGESLRRRGIVSGPVFLNHKKKQAKIGDFQDEFVFRLTRARASKPSLFAPDVVIEEVYHLRRSLRRGATTEAGNQKVPKSIVDLNNRWRKLEQAKGRALGMAMQAHYTEVKQAIPSLWSFSNAL